jgi:hypothetical protein
MPVKIVGCGSNSLAENCSDGAIAGLSLYNGVSYTLLYLLYLALSKKQVFICAIIRFF